MRRKFGLPTLPNLYFRPADGILSVPGYTFEKAMPWEDTGSMTYLAEGSSLKDSSNVLAKISPAQSNGSMCLEREAHILGRMALSSDNPALRMIDFISIPKENGDVVVLLLFHPGPNLLGRYLPPSKINELLLADMSRVRPSSSHGDIYMLGIEEPDFTEEMEAFDIMDLASFLEFAIQATHCLESLHKASIIHREVRANAFHLNAHSGNVRFVHFGNRAISLEKSGSPSSLVLKAFDESEKVKVKEALCYLAPEQTGSIETTTQDHRTDLYSLGIMFWTLLVGRGQMPFEGGPLELLHSIVQKRPMPVHDVRRDVPQVLASIIDKLLAKHPDSRYQSAYGLKTDLIECQRRLLVSVSASADTSATELIPHFDIASQDRFIEFTIPLALFGREKELELVRNVIRNTSTSFSRHFSASKGYISISSSGSQGTGTGNGEDRTDSRSSVSSKSNIMNTEAARSVSRSTPYDQSSVSASITSSLQTSDGLLRTSLRSRPRTARAQVVVVAGPPGVGKSSMILINQAKWRSHGLWGHAKFQNVDSAPFSALLSCLSSVLRQLMVFHTDVHRFVTALKERLGPQIQNVPLLYQGTPELKDVLALLDIHVDTPKERLSSRELRARFQTLVENVFTVVAETRLFALFLDDLHEADDSTLDLVSSFINSKSRMLIFATIRSDRGDVVERVRSMFSSRSKPTWITLEPLSYSAISTLVSKTLHRAKEDCAPLSRVIYSASSGNAFSARSILNTFHRHNFITFNWERNSWQYDMAAIESSLDTEKTLDPTDLTFLVSQLRELPEEARKYLIWAALFGESFKVTEVALMMHLEDASGSSSSEDEHEDYLTFHRMDTTNSPRNSILGLQKALDEGWLIQRARDMCSFAHDRYRQAAQAEAANLPEDVAAKMSFRIVLMMLHETSVDVYRIAEHAKRCLSLLHDHPKRDELLSVLIEAGEAAWTRGAHELAIRSFHSARALLRGDPWSEHPQRTFSLFSRIASLANWGGDFVTSDELVQDCMLHAQRPEQTAYLLRLRSRNHWMRGNFKDALSDNLLALKILGVEIDPAPTRRKADRMFEEVKNEILAVGFDEILSIPRTTDPRHLLAVELLNDAGTNAYWSTSPAFADVIGLTTIQQALRNGMAPGTALGFFFALGGAAEQRELYRFSADLARLALRIAERHGSNSEKCRAQVLYCSMVSGYDSMHISTMIPRLEEAIQYGNSAGDRVYTAFARVHAIITRLFVCEHINELVTAAEDCVNEIKQAASGADMIALAQSCLNVIRALGGYTYARSADTAFDTDAFNEAEYLIQLREQSGNPALAFSWYNSFKIVGFYSLGFFDEAAELGFSLYDTRDRHPNHRHVRYGLFFHSLAMISSMRKRNVTEETRSRYLKQIELNQRFIKKWLSPSPVNTSTWVALVDAELSSLLNKPNANKQYDTAVKLAVNHDWLLEEGWGLYLQGCHFVRTGVEGLGSELQRRGISRHSQWGAQGIVNYLNTVVGSRPQYPLKRPIFMTDVAVQTESATVDDPNFPYGQTNTTMSDEQESTLSASDLASILKWSKDISSDINLSSALQRLTEIATETSGSQNTCVVITREDGDYTVATSMTPPEQCQVYEHPRSVRSLANPLQKAIIQHTINSKERLLFDDAASDSRFAAEARQTVYRSVICLPIFSNRGQTFGTVYVSSKYSFSQNIVIMLTLLCQQASISISNALLFRSVQASTRENLKMIAAQRDALETARKSREDALKATKIKSNFLASMSHELRTPFSSFYGLLDLLSGTELNPGQSEIVQTAKQSCELLLKIIDSILDYSKLEASALKLEPCGFLVENIIADCMELLLPVAAKKLDLSFNIEPDVPPWVYADDARIRQVLMNLIGNAVKFTEKGYVQVSCSVANPASVSSSDEVNIKFVIQDSGIGLSPSDVELLFVPFQQADNSSTRRFGGTGLGLSISRQLVKLMNGAIGVQSELHAGSMFWFTIPVKIFHSEESKRSLLDIQNLRASLQQPQILVISGSSVTLALLNTFFTGFTVTAISNLQDAEMFLRSFSNLHAPLDFIILDDQSDEHANDLAHFLRSLHVSALQDTKIIHLYTPTTNLSRQSIFGTSTPGVVKMTKPPRQARLLQTLAGLKNLPNAIPSVSSTEVSKAMQNVAAAQRTLYGNVLIAEDNPIAQQLLVKQLQRYQLNVTATSNGNEAISEWESRDPGHFTVALFDHRKWSYMPICDGVEAAKRIRMLENKRKCQVMLPIVALSADCQESTKQLCLSAGMNAFFSKPLKKSDLISLLSMFGPSLPVT
ncbi:histidine kinase [Armillaria gallica]|uniref:Histidine kinase n=1 Tax=Armillaria gallica TaxID=47427 RepID=A0A2H3E2A2_ARMGA|nr:histidine kinase [Armillaria gallica]